MHRLQDLVRQHRLGSGARLVARRLGTSPNTERLDRRVIEGAGLLTGDAGAIDDRLRLEQPGFAGSPSAIKRLGLRLGRERCVRAEDVAIPVETKPGEAAQADFG